MWRAGFPPPSPSPRKDDDLAAQLQAALGSAAFRPYASDDLTGVALGGAAKNVYAIACGVVEGMGLGENARAALLARSFAELARLGESLGARRETLMGLSGLGDLVLTATSPSSRNFSFGMELGRGKIVADLSAPGQPLAEGVATAPALVERAHSAGRGNAHRRSHGRSAQRRAAAGRSDDAADEPQAYDRIGTGMKHWLFKSEPETWSWEMQKKKGAKGEPWSGVRNHTAKQNMMAMKKGDLGFFYHSGDEKAVVGIVEVIGEYRPDPTDEKGIFGLVDRQGGEGHAQARDPGGMQGQSQAEGDEPGHQLPAFGAAGHRGRMEGSLQDERPEIAIGGRTCSAKKSPLFQTGLGRPPVRG